jgi:hypothetical protein
MTLVPLTPVNPEIDFLLACARVELSEQHARHLRQLLAHPLNWRRLLALAARHGLLPLLAKHVQLLPGDAIPAAVVADVRRHQHAVALRNLGLSGELVRLLRLLSDHGIATLPFKGPTLAQRAYGDPALREYGDLDLLLRPRDVPCAKALLMEHGYRPQYALPPAQEAAYLRSIGQIPLEKPERAVVELHARLAPRAFPFDLDLSRMWPRRRPVTLLGQSVTAPGGEDLLLILCMHGAKHLWKSVGWICDVAELLRVQPSLNWHQVQHEARRLRGERLLHLGVHLAERALGAPLPPAISRAARHDNTVRTLADQILRQLLGDTEWTPNGMQSAPFHFRLREHWRDGLRYCVSLLATPTLADWKAVSLPLPLAFLYYAVRPMRLLGKYLRLGGRTKP